MRLLVICSFIVRENDIITDINGNAVQVRVSEEVGFLPLLSPVPREKIGVFVPQHVEELK
jgi:hypothetical protein